MSCTYVFFPDEGGQHLVSFVEVENLDERDAEVDEDGIATVEYGPS